MDKPLNVTQKLLLNHLVEGEMKFGTEIGLKIDQTLTQDATGTLVMLELEALQIDKVKTELSVQYIDHNILQTDFKNADDHLFLKSACKKYGIWYSGPGNGVSHPVHMERFGIPGKTLLGSDSHTCAGGALGMLAIGTGGLDVALAMSGEPFYLKMPKVKGIKLTGKLPDWVSAKDIILELLRRYNVNGGRGYIFEYFGEGLKELKAMDRHVIANMGAEMGLTASVFPSDNETKHFLSIQHREKDWLELLPDFDAEYDEMDEVNLSTLEPLIALPSSPGKVVSVREATGKAVHQVVLGSSANPGLRDFWVVSQILHNRRVHQQVSLDVNPSSRQVLENLMNIGAIGNLIHSGARLHQTGCMGCIGMGQAPATGKISLRTVPRNFPGRSGTLDDQVYLCSPETAAAAALTGVITDPRDLENLFGIKYPKYAHPEHELINTDMLEAPPISNKGIILEKGPNIKSIPIMPSFPDFLELPVALKMGNNVSTDEILKAGADVLPLRSNIPEISKWCYYILDKSFYSKALQLKEKFGGHLVVAGENYAQGSSREHAALAPHYLGQKAVVAKSYSRIGWQNLINFGILPLEFENPSDYNSIDTNDLLQIKDLLSSLKENRKLKINNLSKKMLFEVKHSLSDRQLELLLAGGIINYFKDKKETLMTQ